VALAEELYSAKEINEDKTIINCLLTGGSGSGKTTAAAATAPGRKLVINVDNRVESIAGFKDVTILDAYELDAGMPKAWDKLGKIKTWLWSQFRMAQKKGEKPPFDSIIVDGLTSMFDVAMNWSLLLSDKRGLGGSPAEQHWMPQMVAVEKWLLSVLALPCHIIVTAHEDIEEHRINGELFFLPKGTGKLRTKMPGWFNETFYAYRQKEKESYGFFWRTQGEDKRDYLKSSINKLGSLWNDPIRLDLDIDVVMGKKDSAKLQGFAWMLEQKARHLAKGKEEKEGSQS